MSDHYNAVKKERAKYNKAAKRAENIPHPSQVSYDVPIVIIMENLNCVIVALLCSVI